MGEKRHLYIHVPFCKSRCQYCDFHTTVDCWHLVHEYLKAIKEEAHLRKIGPPFHTVFVGGGTPTSLDLPSLVTLLRFLKELAPSPREFTFEANPESLSQEKISLLRGFGVNRISIGIQSFNEKCLKLSGRIHDLKDAEKGIELAFNGGFESINLDLIIGLPGSEEDDANLALKRIKEAKCHHISAYYLDIPRKSAFAKKKNKGQLDFPDEDFSVKQMKILRDGLGKMGFIWYELSNFAKKNHLCAHNLNVWNRGPYLGLGPGAASFARGTRSRNYPLLKYLQILGRGIYQPEYKEKLSGNLRAWEGAILALRTFKGVNIKKFSAKYGDGFLRGKWDMIGKMAADGLIIMDEERFVLSEKGRDFSNEVFIELLPDIN